MSFFITNKPYSCLTKTFSLSFVHRWKYFNYFPIFYLSNRSRYIRVISWFYICQFYGIPLEGEEVQYLGQDLVDRTWDIAKIFLCDCDCCKNKRNEKKRDFEGNESHEK